MTRISQLAPVMPGSVRCRRLWFFLLPVGIVVVMVALAGCARRTFLARAITPAFEPGNIYREEGVLPSHIRRVAILPMSVSSDEGDLSFGRDTLEPIMRAEIGRVRRFEVVSISIDELRLLSGRGLWSAQDKLPLDFFERIREKFGADAVLFTEMTQFRGYEPLAVGWRCTLVETDEPHVLWAVDEVFDARIPSVAAAAIRYSDRNPDTSATLSDSRSVLISPRRFGRYAAHAVAETMPGRVIAAN